MINGRVAYAKRSGGVFAVYNIYEGVHENNIRASNSKEGSFPMLCFCSLEESFCVLIGFGRLGSRSLSRLRSGIRTVCPGGGIVIGDCTSRLTGRCTSRLGFHGKVLITNVIAVVVTLFKLINCADSRIGHHHGRVTVEGIGKTGIGSVLHVFLGSVVGVTLPYVVINSLKT